MNRTQEEQLLKLIQERQYVTVENLAKELFLSPSSVRRRLGVLEEKGLISRTHGGAKTLNESSSCPAFSYRTHQNIQAKKKIAEAAADLVRDGDVIFLDGSSSGFFLVEFLGRYKNIRVITNGIDTLSQLLKHKIPVISTGGEVKENDTSLLVGSAARETVAKFHANVAFFSAVGVTREGEIFDTYEEENEVIRTMLSHSEKGVMLCDSTKFDKTAPYRLGSIREIDFFLTDGESAKDFFPAFPDKLRIASKKETKK